MTDSNQNGEVDYEISGIDEAEEPEASTAQPSKPVSADEFFAKHAFRLVYQTNNFFLPQIKDLVTKGDVLNIRPEYQRRLRWNTVQKSRLIESLLLNIPIPPIFLYENDEARYEVMDGQQRLNAIKEFFEGSYQLTGLEVLSPLNKLRYSIAPPRIKRALDRASISAIVLLLDKDNERPPDSEFTIADIRRFIFDRLNTGGTKLNAQEIRNAIYPGEFNKTIIDLTRNELFTTIFKIPPYIETDPNDYYENPERQKNTLYATMGDCQLVLRYFALRDPANIRGSMKSMLERAMSSRISTSKEEAGVLASEYLDRLKLAMDVFGPTPFLLPPDEKGRARLSAALYDATLVALHNLILHREAIKLNKNQIIARLLAEFDKLESSSILTAQGNTAKTVRDRIQLMQQVISDGAGIP